MNKQKLTGSEIMRIFINRVVQTIELVVSNTSQGEVPYRLEVSKLNDLLEDAIEDERFLTSERYKKKLRFTPKQKLRISKMVTFKLKQSVTVTLMKKPKVKKKKNTHKELVS